MEAFHIIIVLVLMYLVYDFILPKPNKQLAKNIGSNRLKTVNNNIKSQSNNNIKSQSNNNITSSNNITSNQTIAVDQPIPSNLVVPYNPFMDSGINPYTGELVEIKTQMALPNEPSYDIMDRDILSKFGRDTIQGFYKKRTSTNEMLWESGGSLFTN